MSLRSNDRTLQSARLASARECIGAGVPPGLQTLCGHTGRANVAGDDPHASAPAASTSGDDDAANRPDQAGAGRNTFRSSAVAAAETERHQVAASLRRMRRPSRWLLPAGLTEAELMSGYDRASIVTLGAVVASAVATWFGVSPWGCSP